jgi:RNA polymerase primary sigma factor
MSEKDTYFEFEKDEEDLKFPSSLEIYFKEISKTPLLTKEEEFELAEKIECGDECAKEKLVVANLRLVIHLAKKFKTKGLPLLDLIEEGNLGLIHAAERFKGSRGFRFSTYATWWVKQYIARAIVNQANTIRIPVHIVELIRNYYKTQKELTQKLGREPLDNEVADAMNITVKKIQLITSLLKGIKSLNNEMSLEAYEQLLEMLVDENVLPPNKYIEKHLKNKRVIDLFSKLSEKERVVLRLRFGLGGEEFHTLSEAGENLGVSRERIRQIEKKALEKLRKFILFAEKTSKLM